MSAIFKYKFTDNDFNKMLAMRKDGKRMADIAKEFSVSTTPIYYLFKQKGLMTRDVRMIDDDKISKILSLYSLGKSTPKIAIELNMPLCSVISAFKRTKTKRRRQGIGSRTHNINQNFFEKIDSDKKAYIFGLIYGDGCNKYYPEKTTYVVTLCLKSEDKYMLEDINEILQSDYELRYREETNTYILTINSKKMSEDLLKLGCVPRKSLIKKFPTYDIVPQEFFSHFLRGYFDANGSASYREKSKYGDKMISISIYSSDDFIVGLSQYLINNLLIKNACHKDGKVSYCCFAKRENVSKFFEYIYKNATIFLRRKHKRYINFKNYCRKVDDDSISKEINGIKYKRCFTCREYLPLDSFYNYKTSKSGDGKTGRCKKCSSFFSKKAWAKKNSDEIEKGKLLELANG